MSIDTASFRKSLPRFCAPAALVFSSVLVASAAFAQVDKPAEGMDMQRARAAKILERGKKAYYTKTWDLSDVPAYVPQQKISGTIRIWGSNYITDGNLGDYWTEAFHKFHPDAKLDFHTKASGAAVPSLIFGVSDIGVGRKIMFGELEMFERYKDHDPIEINFATGSYDVAGWQPGYGIVVHKDNPLAQISMDEIDGVFGAERSGGWLGTSWHPEFARGRDKNIRTWGQLGLTGEWADKPIDVYGLNLRYHQASEMADRLLKGSDKWNEQMHIYANYVTADGKLSRSLNDDLSRDPYGIAWVAAPTTVPPGLKILKLGWKKGGPFVPYTMETLHDRSYPLYDEVYFYADEEPGKGVDPKVKEFLRFTVSREGQAEIMRDGKYLPLTGDLARQQLKKLQ